MKQIPTENLVYKVSQLTLSMDIFMDSVIDMMYLRELFAGRTRKRPINRLEAENLKDVKLRGMDRSAVDEKLKM